MADTAAILARFPGPVLLRPSRLKWSVYTVLTLLWAIGSAWGLHAFATAEDYSPWILILNVVVAGLLAVMGIGHLIPGVAGLTLDRDGFEVRDPVRRWYYPWNDVSAFEVAGSRLDFLLRNRWPPRRVVFDSMAKRAGKPAEGGRNSALIDPCGMDPAELATLLNDWRERALRAAGKWDA